MKKLGILALVLTMVLAGAGMAVSAPIKLGIINNPPSESGYREANVRDF